MVSNYSDTLWDFEVNGGYGNTETPWRNKTDTSKVYVKNLNTSSGSVSVTIYGRNGNEEGEETNCTYHTVNGLKNYPFTIVKNSSKKCSSTVREIYHSGAQASLHIGATSGIYHGKWSPDNYAGD